MAPTEEELLILRRAVERGLATQAQVDALLGDQATIEQLGGKAGISELLVRKNLCTDDDVDSLREATVVPTPTEDIDGISPFAPSAADEADQKVLAGYRIIERIGRGGMGAVFKAEQVSMQRIVALKVLAPKLVENPAYVERFLREARAAARLDHPNIVRGIDAGCDQGYYYLAMEFVEGKSLRKILKKAGKLEEKKALGIAVQVAAALQHAQENGGIVHRDVKPDNILLAPDGTAKLADMGLAKSAEDDAGLTRVGAAIGTPHYLSPEQARGQQDLDTRTDIYSLGATLYHALTGAQPYTGPTSAVVLSKHVSEPVVPPRQLNPAISPRAEAIVLKMLEKDPDDRYATPVELIEDLKLALEGGAPVHAAITAPTPAGKTASGRTLGQIARSRRTDNPAAAVGGIALVVGLIVLILIVVGKASRETGGPDGGSPSTPGTPGAVHTPSAASIAAQQREGQAQASLELAREFAGDYSKSFRKIVEMFQAVADDYPGTRAAAVAQAEAERHASRWDAAAREAFDKEEKEIEEFLAKREFGNAYRRLGQFPSYYEVGPVKQKQVELKEHVDAAVAATQEKLREQVEALLETAQVDEALQLLEEVELMDSINLTRWAKDESLRVRRIKNMQERQLQRDAEMKLTEIDKSLAEELHHRNYEEAHRIAAEAVDNLQVPAVLPKYQQRLDFTQTVEAFWARFTEGAEEHLVGQQLQAMGELGTVSRIKDGKAMVSLGNVELPRKLTTLTDSVIARVAERSSDPESGNDFCLLASFWIAEGKYDRAKGELAKAERLDADITLFNAMIEALSPHR